MVAIFSVAALVVLASTSLAKKTGIPACDALIDAGLGNLVLNPTGPNGAYIDSVNSYYGAGSRQLRPYCILQPETAEDVSKAVKALSALSGAGKSDIAVRGRGHGHWENNNINQGVTIDLGRMNETTIQTSSCNQTIAAVGAGSEWAGPAVEAEKHNLTVASGRVGNVGVAGLTLGCGMGFMTGHLGFACDSVVNYEIVLSNGDIAEANRNENPDLFKALKGGGSNFGIVTRFDFKTYPVRDVYGGLMFHPWSYREQLADSMIKVIGEIEKNHDDSQFIMYMNHPGAPEPVVGNMIMNLHGRDDTPLNVAANEMDKNVDMRAHSTMAEFLNAYRDPGGSFNVWHTTIFHNERRLLDKVADIFLEVVADTKRAFPESTATIIFVLQPMPKFYGTQRGSGNVLGLDKTLDADSIILAAEAGAATLEERAFFTTRLAQVIADVEEYAKSVDGYVPYKYMNYADPSQDTFSSYGADNVAFLKRVAKEYDPAGFFQTRVTGGFKLSNVQ